MKKIYLLVFCLLLIDISDGYSQVDRINRIVKQLDDNAPAISLAPLNTSPILPPFILAPASYSGDVIIGPEILTGLDGFYDYKTNGEANHYIQVDPTNPLLLHSVDMQADSLDPTGVTTRRTKYAISSDGGTTWAFVNDVPLIRSGFVVLELHDNGTTNRVAALANHYQPLTTLKAILNVDAFAQLGAFTPYETSGNSIWPQITALSNNNIILMARPQSSTVSAQNDTLFYSIWNGTTMGTENVAFIATPPYQGGATFSNTAYNVADNDNGMVGMIFNPELEDEVLGLQVVKMRLSSDNGANFGSEFDVFTPFVDGIDTINMVGGHDLTFKSGTNDWYWAGVAAGATFGTTRLYMIRGTGSTVTSTTLIADSNNIPDRAPFFYKAWAFQFPIDHPKLGWSADNNVLYCSFDVATRDTGMNGFNTRDVFYMYSTDAGGNWSDPVRITNTPTIDEGFPSISLWNAGTSAASYELNLVYMKDVGDGPTSFNGASPTAPPSHNFQVYRKITLATTIGISNNSSINPDEYKLLQNYPNPFNPSTTISFNLPKKDFVTLKIYNSAGIEVATLLKEDKPAGLHNVRFEARNLSSGVYFYTLVAEGFKETKKMVLLK